MVNYHRQPSFDEWRDTLEKIFADPQRQAGFGFLLNREWIVFPAEADYIMRMVDFIDEHQVAKAPIRWAIFVSDAGSFARGRLAEQLTKHKHSIRVFYRRPEADAWLLGGD